MATETSREQTEALQSLEQRLRAVQDLLSEIQNEVQCLAGEQQEPESVRCMECEAVVPRLSTALKLGWNELLFHDGEYLGMCPACLQSEDRAVEATVRQADEPSTASEQRELI